MLVTNSILFTLGASNRMIESGAVRIDGGRITHVATTAELRKMFPTDEIFDAGGQLLMPGNICGHTHFYGAFARGMALTGDPPADFPAILGNLWWRLDKALSAEDVKSSALVCLVDAIKHGTTTLFDHHASPSCLEGSLGLIAEAVMQSGARSCLCYEVTDRNGPDEARAGIEENAWFLDRCLEEMHPLIRASFGLHASLTLSDETLDDCFEAATEFKTGFHIHAAEGIADVEDSLRKSKKRVIKRLAEAGILGPLTILAHCVHINESEMDLIRETESWVTHQPRSNMNNAVGTAPVEAMLRKGIKVALGNDGFSNAMWEEWKAAYLVHKAISGDPRSGSGMDVFKMAVTNNAAMARSYWPEAPMGEISEGAFADLILVDYRPYTELSAGNLPWHIIFGFQPGDVTSTMVDGKWLMRDRKLLTLDEAEILKEARRLSATTWERYKKL